MALELPRMKVTNQIVLDTLVRAMWSTVQNAQSGGRETMRGEDAPTVHTRSEQASQDLYTAFCKFNVSCGRSSTQKGKVLRSRANVDPARQSVKIAKVPIVPVFLSQG